MHVNCETANLFKQKVYQDFVFMKKKHLPLMKITVQTKSSEIGQ